MNSNRRPLTTSEVARRLSITPHAVRYHARRGHLQAARLADGERRTRLYDADSVDRLAAEREQAATVNAESHA